MPRNATAEAGRVRSVHRFPVKSLAGETLARARVDRRGLVGDRSWAVRDPDGRLGSGKTTRRFRRMDGLLALRATYDAEVPVVEWPDGRRLRGGTPELDAALSAHVGRPVSLGRETSVPHFDDGPVHLVTTATARRLGAVLGRPVDVRRFRANLVVDTPGDEVDERDWTGRELRIGDVVLAVRAAMPRCVMLDASQADLPADGELLRTVHQVTDGEAGVWADVVKEGTVRAGDPVLLG